MARDKRVQRFRKKKDYDGIRENLETGDIVLFSGKGIGSATIKIFSKSKWSHVGMVLRSEDWDMVLLWQSTPSNYSLEDIESGKPKKGVQLVALREYIKLYHGEIGIRHLKTDRTSEMITALKNFRKEVKDRPFEEDLIEMFRSSYEGPFGHNVEDISSLFCSELIAESYQRMGLLKNTPPSNEYTPRDFSSENGLELLKGAVLEKEIMLS